MMFFRWLTSQTLRNALTLRKHVRRLLAAQRDILAPQAITNLENALKEYDAVIAAGADNKTLLAQMQKLEEAANKWIKPYPHAGWRENIEVILVAVGVAMAIRTFFIQPFKIPTGSMQPTLFGVTSDNLINDPNFTIPTGLERVKQWFEGVSYVHVVAQTDGTLSPTTPMTYFRNGAMQVVEPPVKFLIFNICQSFTLGGVRHTMWFPPDLGEAPLEFRCGLDADHVYHKGEDVIKLRMAAGDHLFVDRITYNFRKPERGEIIVFATGGTKIEKQDEFYIKRLTVLPNERVQIGNDRHMIINGKRLDKTTPHFENIYGFDPATPPREKPVFRSCQRRGGAAVQFISQPRAFVSRPGHRVYEQWGQLDGLRRQHLQQLGFPRLGHTAGIQCHWQILLCLLAVHQPLRLVDTLGHLVR